MDVWWHNRRRLPLGEHRAPRAEHGSLEPLVSFATECARATTDQ
jgi:hypothetical protein